MQMERSRYGNIQDYGTASNPMGLLTTSPGYRQPESALSLYAVPLLRPDIAIPISAGLSVEHASPIAPLRQRDRVALEAMFDRPDLPAISLDIHRSLARLYPEPCWEDEPYEFLHGYI